MLTLPEVAERLGIPATALIPYGRSMAKLDLPVAPPTGRLVLVTAMTPTPAGEGKTTTAIGLSDGFTRRGRRASVVLREPSLGPCFGRKGGGTGGGAAQVTPGERINLHFTGDFHAVGAAHNLASALVDNALHFGGRLDPRRVTWKRVMDVNDRSLREVVVGLGGRGNGVPRESGFDITAASEVMASLCMSEDGADLRARLTRIVVGWAADGSAVTLGEIGAVGSMMALLNDVLAPNLVQTLGGTPAVVHGGPFANIAHGCPSWIGLRTAMAHSDWVITEAGFGFDLGGEKFLDLLCAPRGVQPSAVVLIATLRALRHHGGATAAQLELPSPAAVDRGLANLAAHTDGVTSYQMPLIITLNRHGSDSAEEVALVERWAAARGVRFQPSDPYGAGGEGCEALAEVVESIATPTRVVPRQAPDAPFATKVESVARSLYGAAGVHVRDEAAATVANLAKQGYGELPVCIAKTQASLSDDEKVRGRPAGHTLTVRAVELAAGAGFLVALCGDTVRMPGLPRHPNSERVDVVDGRIVGVG